ncbi:MAG: hypothetical protein ACFNS8_06545, partial [Kingella oralis]
MFNGARTSSHPTRRLKRILHSSHISSLKTRNAVIPAQAGILLDIQKLPQKQTVVCRSGIYARHTLTYLSLNALQLKTSGINARPTLQRFQPANPF